MNSMVTFKIFWLSSSLNFSSPYKNNLRKRYLSRIVQVRKIKQTSGASTALSCDKYWQIPLSNYTWIVSKQNGTIYADPINTNRYNLKNKNHLRKIKKIIKTTKNKK